MVLLYKQNPENLQREGWGGAFSAQIQTKGVKENEASHIFWGFTETNQLREGHDPTQFPPNITHSPVAVVSTYKSQV